LYIFFLDFMALPPRVGHEGFPSAGSQGESDC
jgi:hypothetical protein